MLLRRLGVALLLAAGIAASRGAAAEPETASAQKTVAPPVANATYDSRLADARRLAAEGSWAHARDAYAEALTLAPDADARRWCELWIEDATCLDLADLGVEIRHPRCGPQILP